MWVARRKMKKYQCSPTLSLGPRLPLPLSQQQPIFSHCLAKLFILFTWWFSKKLISQSSTFVKPSYTQTHTYAHAYTHTYFLAHIHMDAHTPRQAHIHTQACTHPLTHARTHAHTLSQSCNVYTTLALNSSILLQLLPVFSDFLFKSIGSESFEGEKKEMLIQKVVFEYFKFSILISSWSLISETKGQSTFILLWDKIINRH